LALFKESNLWLIHKNTALLKNFLAVSHQLHIQTKTALFSAHGNLWGKHSQNENAKVELGWISHEKEYTIGFKNRLQKHEKSE
jgi:hypothetical protein